jgi:multidrug efflux pump subunit AcrB
MTIAGIVRRYGGAIVLLVILGVTAGAVALRGLPSSIYPPLDFPRALVIAHAGSTPARAMAFIVTRPLEQAAMEVPGIRRVRSTTFRGATEISAQFMPGTDMVVALQQLQNRVAETRGALPADAQLNVERLTTAAFPILSLNVTGGLPIADLRDYAYYVMRPALARAPGVGRVDVLASDTREIEVVVDPAKLQASHVALQDVTAALRGTNVLTAIGQYPNSGQQYLAFASGQWTDLAALRQTPVAVRAASGTTIRIGDVADVFPAAPDRTTLVTGNGRDAAVVNISQQVGTNVLTVRDGVAGALAGLAQALPSGLTVTKVYDLAEFVSTALASVREAMLIGALLAIAILWLFLRDLRLTFIAATTLPLTVVATFLVMRLAGESINVMSMGGLAVAIGLVIDDAVVVVENLHRHLLTGRRGDEIERAMAEIVTPVVTSTVTTVVVFAPLGLLSGVAGDFFRALSVTLSAAVLISLALALTFVPLLVHWRYGRTDAAQATSPAPEGDAPQGSDVHANAHADTHDEEQVEAHGRLEHLFDRTQRPMLARPAWMFAAVATLALAAIVIYPRLAAGFLPQMDEGGFVIDYLSPAGTALNETDRQVRAMERIVAATPDVLAFSRRTGSELGLFATQQNKGDILVRLKPRGQRRAADVIMNELREKLHEASPALDLELLQLLSDMLGDLEGAPTPIEVKIFGDDPETLARITTDVEAKLEQTTGVVDIVGAQRGNPEVEWDVDPVAAGRLGLTVEQVAQQVSTAWLGETVTELRRTDRTVPVRVRYPDRARFDPAQFGALPIQSATGTLVPLRTLARPTMLDSQNILMRENLRGMALVTARLEGRDLGSAVQDITQMLPSIALPPGYTIELGGQLESRKQAFDELLLVLGLACALVLVVLVIEFRAFRPALVILGVAPLSFAGAFAMLALTGTELNVSSAMGLILLVGLVVKNGIVLLDYAHHLHERGTNWREAVARASRRRLRPILMTTLCTLLGLLPLALGLGVGAELQRPLALAVIGGLALSTPIVLYALPACYIALRRDGHATPTRDDNDVSHAGS